MYCRKENTLLITLRNVNESLAPIQYSEPRLAHNVVLRMVEGLLQVELVVIMDNFFSNIGLFKNSYPKVFTQWIQ